MRQSETMEHLSKAMKETTEVNHTALGKNNTWYEYFVTGKGQDGRSYGIEYL